MGRLQKLNDILKVINSSPNIVELEWEQNGKKVFIKRALKPKVNTTIDSTETVSTTKENNILKEQAEYIIKSLSVGTCYLVSPQDKKEFVKVGDKVKNSQKLCLIEAMKVFKEVLSDKEGVVKEILVENGQSVEYGQPLFKLII